MIQLTHQRAQDSGPSSGQNSDCSSPKTEMDFSKVKIRRRLQWKTKRTCWNVFPVIGSRTSESKRLIAIEPSAERSVFPLTQRFPTVCMLICFVHIASFLLHYHNTEIHLFEAGLYNPLAPVNYENYTFQRLDALYACLLATKSFSIPSYAFLRNSTSNFPLYPMPQWPMLQSSSLSSHSSKLMVGTCHMYDKRQIFLLY